MDKTTINVNNHKIYYINEKRFENIKKNPAREDTIKNKVKEIIFNKTGKWM